MNPNDRQRAMFVKFTKGKKVYMPFPECREKARMLAMKHNIKSEKDWHNYCAENKLPSGMPTAPNKVYSHQNIQKNIRNGVDIYKKVYY